MSEATQGGDRHAWQSEYEGLAEDLRTEPADALPELLDLVERMLGAAGYQENVPGAQDEPEVVVVLERARELVEGRERRGPPSATTTRSRPRASCAASTSGCSTRRRPRRAPTSGIGTAICEAVDDEAAMARARSARYVLLRPAGR